MTIGSFPQRVALCAAAVLLPLAASAQVSSAPVAPPPAWDKVPLALGQTKPDLVLTGTVDRSNYQTNVPVPFDVPAGVEQIGIELTYTRPDNKTVINLGLFEGTRFRGWSGSNKHAVVIGETNATPSYIPGPVGGRRWALDLGISFIGEGVTSEYTAKVYFWRHGDKPAVSTFSPEPLAQGARWYRGDFHMHTGESDGFCDSRKGRHIPCPVYKTVEGAEAAHLDFIAITDHNNVGHYNAMRELQPFFDDVLLIPGRELTTEQGHANMFGSTEFVDYRLGEKSVPDMKTMLRMATEAGAIVAVNHPSSPSDFRCRGCGWTAPADAMPYVTAMEAMNAGSLWKQLAGTDAGDNIVRWEAEVAKGRRITAIGGSDNHDIQLGRLAVGFPTTMVYAPNLSERAILDGVQAGHVWVDLTGAPGHGFDLVAHAGAKIGMIGDNLALAKGQKVALDLRLRGSKGAALVGFIDGKPAPELGIERIADDDSAASLTWTGDGSAHWIRFEVREGAKRILFTNPVYLNFAQ
ncbi:CehA/McbA family metallohydrolase [Sphingomonas sp. dw_22]|uniref:CehA/McbA family metallohydrolase n=1 Tax=Sphingomonas sp. dw_22 TaxID=2721175 RepID=UPI001BD5319F|nr:CehA/McbA family metallohydrolase [Sphingomonas sp. dw_22]